MREKKEVTLPDGDAYGKNDSIVRGSCGDLPGKAGVYGVDLSKYAIIKTDSRKRQRKTVAICGKTWYKW